MLIYASRIEGRKRNILGESSIHYCKSNKKNRFTTSYFFCGTTSYHSISSPLHLLILVVFSLCTDLFSVVSVVSIIHSR